MSSFKILNLDILCVKNVPTSIRFVQKMSDHYILSTVNIVDGSKVLVDITDSPGFQHVHYQYPSTSSHTHSLCLDL